MWYLSGKTPRPTTHLLFKFFLVSGLGLNNVKFKGLDFLHLAVDEMLRQI